MSPLAKIASLSIAVLVALPVSNAFASDEVVSAADSVTCVPIPPVWYQDHNIYPGGEVCVPTP